MNNTKLPVIFILDMDETIVGKCYNIDIYVRSLPNYINDGCKYKEITDYCNIDNNSLKNSIDKNIIRPHFKEFIEEINKHFPTAEFFIYSAGANFYVNYIIEYVEEVINFKFNRPLFTRSDISKNSYHDWLKDITGFTDIIMKSLENKYKLSNDDISFILTNRTIIIDDNKSVWNNDYRQVKCNQYNYVPIIEFDNNLLKHIFNNKTYKFNINYFPKIENNMTYQDFISDYHLSMYLNYKKVIDTNKKELNDTFFKNLLQLIKPRNKFKIIFGKKIIKSINNKIK